MDYGKQLFVVQFTLKESKSLNELKKFIENEYKDFYVEVSPTTMVLRAKDDIRFVNRFFNESELLDSFTLTLTSNPLDIMTHELEIDKKIRKLANRFDNLKMRRMF